MRRRNSWPLARRRSSVVQCAIGIAFTLTVHAHARFQHPKIGSTYVDFYLSRPIEPRDVQHYRSLIQWSDAQQKAIDDFFAEYRQRTADRDGDVQSLFARAERIAASNALYTDPQVASEFQGLMADRERVSNLLEQDEDRFFAATERLLADAQKPGFARARAMRSRQRVNLVPCEVPGGKFDLEFTLAAMNMLDPAWAIDGEGLSTLLSDYSRQVTPMRIEYARDQLVAIEKAPSVYANMSRAPAGDPSLQQANRDAHDRIMAMRRDADRTAARVYELNVQFLSSLTGVLSTQGVEQVTRSFREQTFPSVYPDVADVSALMSLASTLPMAPSTSPESLNATIAEYAAKYRTLSQKMERTYLAYQSNWLTHRSHDQQSFDAFANEMADLQQQRQRLALQTILQMRALIPDPEFISESDECENEIRTHTSRVNGFSFTP